VNAPDLKITLSVREATAEDLRAILALYAQEGLDEGSVLELDDEEAIFDHMRAYPDYRLYVAELGGRVVGTFALLVMRNLIHLGAASGLVEAVGVDAALRSQGIGRAMMEHARVLCRARGCYKMALSSNLKRERAHAFYDGLGFERHGYSFQVKP
jgi:GNAT superfamily N-acetyltransferase